MTTTIADLKAARATAGANYANAAQALADAWVQLHGYDMACANAAFSQGPQPAFAQQPTLPLHAEFLRQPLPVDLASQAYALHLQLLKSAGAA